MPTVGESLGVLTPSCPLSWVLATMQSGEVGRAHTACSSPVLGGVVALNSSGYSEREQDPKTQPSGSFWLIGWSLGVTPDWAWVLILVVLGKG